MAPSRRRVVYLPIEETSREFESRVLIASCLADVGVHAVLAPQATIWHSLTNIPLGAVLFKGNNTAQARPMAAAKRAGHFTASIEEEALGIRDPREITRLYDASIPHVCDLIFVHGASQAEALRTKFPGIDERLYLSGNPRIDLLRRPLDEEIRAQAAALREKHGPYILINTNLASINYRGEDIYSYYELCCDVGVISDESDSDFQDFKTWCRWEHGNLAATVGFLKELRETKVPWTVILRPHPSEDMTPWVRAIGDADDVQVIREGNHLAWTAGAEVLVHTSCTTGFEAFILGTPAVSLCTTDNPWNDMFVSNLTSTVCDSAAAAAALVRALIAGEVTGLPDQDECRERLDPHYSLSSHETAARRISRALEGSFENVDPSNEPVCYGFSSQEAPETKIDLGLLSPSSVNHEIRRQGFVNGGAVAVESLGQGAVLVRPASGPPARVMPVEKPGARQARGRPSDEMEFLAVARDDLRAHRLGSALTMARKASVMSPNNAEAPQLLARAFHMLGRGVAVGAQLRWLEVLTPNQTMTAIAIARYFMGSGEMEKAIHWARKAIERHRGPAPAERLLDLARALRAGDRVAEAEEILNKLVELNPAYGKIREILGLGATRAGFSMFPSDGN